MGGEQTNEQKLTEKTRESRNPDLQSENPTRLGLS